MISSHDGSCKLQRRVTGRPRKRHKVQALCCAVWLSFSFAHVSIAGDPSDPVTNVAATDPAMLAAFANARATLDDFLAMAAAPPDGTGDFTVKIPIRQGTHVEYFWIYPFQGEGADTFFGTIANSPAYVTNVAEGQTVRFQREDIVDWSYREVSINRTHGNFTACVLLTYESDPQSVRMAEANGIRCDHVRAPVPMQWVGALVIAAVIFYLIRRGDSPRTAVNESERELLACCLGNRQQAERLIALEQRHAPEISRREAVQRALRAFRRGA